MSDRPTTEPRPPEVGEFESLHHAVGKALYGWADDEPNAATGAVARMEVAGVVLAVIDWLEARATPPEAVQGAAPRAEGLAIDDFRDDHERAMRDHLIANPGTSDRHHTCGDLCSDDIVTRLLARVPEPAPSKTTVLPPASWAGEGEQG